MTRPIMPGGEELLQQAEALLKARLLPEALRTFDYAEAARGNPDRCCAGRWLAHMLMGDFESAWCASDDIRQRGAPDHHRFWQGESLSDRRIMLRCLHGFGDSVQFLRYVPLLSSIASRVIVEVHQRFVELARCFEGVEEVITWGEQAPAQIPEWDAQVEVMELPHIFRTQLVDLPRKTAYLRLPEPVPLLSSDRLRVGLVWTAGTWDSERAIPPRLLQPIVEVEGCEFWNLQGASCQDSPFGRGARGVLHEEKFARNSLVGLAGTIAQMDLVITVDTLAAHLAGALGVPGLVLLRREADWRWMHERDDSPWYPSLRLYRQVQDGQWERVIASVCDALRQRVQTRSHQELVA